MNYEKKYLKYKKKYLTLKGGECKPIPNLDNIEPITHELYKNMTPDQRITINKQCYNVDALYKRVITEGNNTTPVDEKSIIPNNRLRIALAKANYHLNYTFLKDYNFRIKDQNFPRKSQHFPIQSHYFLAKN